MSRLSPVDSGVPRGEFVTGERLQSLAGISVIPRASLAYHRRVRRFAKEMVVVDDPESITSRDLARLSEARVLFVYTHAFDDFVEYIWPRLTGAQYVLITHNSDGEVGRERLGWIENTGDKLARWFAQNVTATHPKLVPLPIGIANSMWRHGNLRVLGRAVKRAAGSPKTELLFVRSNPVTHAARGSVLEKIDPAFSVLQRGEYVPSPFPTYLTDLARHRFCLCPRGNGIDTHRLWECLYLRVIPIVERSPHVEYWYGCGLPLLIVDDWSEVTPDRLEVEAHGVEAFPRGHDALLLSHYARLLRAAAASPAG